MTTHRTYTLTHSLTFLILLYGTIGHGETRDTRAKTMTCIKMSKWIDIQTCVRHTEKAVTARAS